MGNTRDAAARRLRARYTDTGPGPVRDLSGRLRWDYEN